MRIDHLNDKHKDLINPSRLPKFTRADIQALVFGSIACVLMIFLHPYLIGVPVLG